MFFIAVVHLFWLLYITHCMNQEKEELKSRVSIFYCMNSFYVLYLLTNKCHTKHRSLVLKQLTTWNKLLLYFIANLLTLNFFLYFLELNVHYIFYPGFSWRLVISELVQIRAIDTKPVYYDTNQIRLTPKFSFTQYFQWPVGHTFL